MKKVLSLAIVLLLLMSVCAALPAQANDMSGALTDSITWGYDSATQTLTISGTGEMPDYGDGNPSPYQFLAQSAKKAVVGAGVTCIGAHAFLCLDDLEEIVIPASVTNIHYGFIWGEYPNLTAITVDSNNPYYSAADGVLYNKDQTAILRYAVGKADQDFVIPNSVTEIGRGAFAWAQKLESVTIPSGISVIPYESLIQCDALKTLTVPKSVVEVEDWAIENAPLTDIYYSGTKEDWDDITIHRSDNFGSANYHITNAPLFGATIHCTDGDMVIQDTPPCIFPSAQPSDTVSGVMENTWRVNITDSSVPETVTVNGTDYLDTEAADAAKYLGYAVTLEVNGDTVLSAVPDDSKNNIVKIDCRNVEFVENDTLYYFADPKTDKQVTALKPAENAVILLNNQTADLADLEGIETGNITAISNDGNSENGYEYIIANAYTNQIVVKAIPENAIDAYDANTVLNTTYYDLAEEGVKNIFYVDGIRTPYPGGTLIVDGNQAYLRNFHVWSTVSVIGDDTPLRIFYVSNQVEFGTVSRITHASGRDYYSIDQSTDTLEAEDGADIQLADESYYFVNVDGKIVYSLPLYQTKEYRVGYLMDQQTELSFGKQRLKLLYLDETGQETVSVLSDPAYLGIGNHSYEKTPTSSLNSIPLERGIFFYRKNGDSTILDLIIPASGDATSGFRCLGSGLSGTYDAQGNQIVTDNGNIQLTDNAVLYSVTGEQEGSAAKITDAYQNGETITDFAAYGTGDGAKVIVLEDGSEMLPTDAPTEAPTVQPTFPPMPVVDESDNVVIVTSVSTTKFGDDNGYVIEGLKDGKAVTLNVCNAQQLCWNASLLTENRIEPGDAIMVAEYNNFVSHIEKKVDANALKFRQMSGSGYQQSVRYSWEDFIHLATERKNNDVTFDDGTEKNLSGACFTLVSNNGSGRLTIKSSSIGYINTANTKGYRYVVYVRSYDNIPIDVVIYEFYPNVEIPMAGIPHFADPSDVNGDGKTDAKDVTLLRRSIVGAKGGKDVNLDGQIDAKDVTFLRRFIANHDHYDPAL